MSAAKKQQQNGAEKMDVADGQPPAAGQASQLAQSAGLEGDDEFEEFPIQAHALNDGQTQQEPVNVWEDNWDDESATPETDFDRQLKEELEKHGHKSA